MLIYLYDYLWSVESSKLSRRIIMFKRINDFLSGLLMTITGGIFLIISFILNRVDFNFFVDPAWVTVIICGLPLLYLSVHRLIYGHQKQGRCYSRWDSKAADHKEPHKRYSADAWWHGNWNYRIWQWDVHNACPQDHRICQGWCEGEVYKRNRDNCIDYIQAARKGLSFFAL